MPSTKREETNTVQTKREYYVPEYGVTVWADSPEDAVEVAKKAAKQES